MPKDTLINPVKGDMSPEAVRARIAEYCEWFGAPWLKIKVRSGQVYMTDDLLAWHKEHGASLDWIIFGEAKAMARAYREKHATEREMVEVLGRFDDVEQKKMIEVLQAQAAGQMTFEAAMAEFKAFVSERRADQTA